jgi:hypothetical protein
MPAAGAGVARDGDEGGLADDARVRTARALAGLPRLAHLRLASQSFSVFLQKPEIDIDWGSSSVAAELARCPVLRVLEVDRTDDPLWRHEPDPGRGATCACRGRPVSGRHLQRPCGLAVAALRCGRPPHDRWPIALFNRV